MVNGICAVLAMSAVLVVLWKDIVRMAEEEGMI